MGARCSAAIEREKIHQKIFARFISKLDILRDSNNKTTLNCLCYHGSVCFNVC